MTVTAPTAAYLSTLPVTPNNRNQLASFLSSVADLLNGTTANASTLLLGEASAYPTGLTHITFDNLDTSIAANWHIAQGWFDTDLARNDTMFFVGYNFSNAGGRVDATEPAWGLQLESYDVSALGGAGDPLLAGHLTMITTSDTVVRPWSVSIIRSSNVSDMSFTNRYFIVNDQSDHSLIHAAYGSTANVGIGTIASSNANLHVKTGASTGILWEYGSGAADNKYWDWVFSAGAMYLRCVNDAYGAAGTVFTVARSGTTVSSFTLGTLLKVTTSTYANNAAAVTGGLAVGSVYKTATGELREVV